MEQSDFLIEISVNNGFVFLVIGWKPGPRLRNTHTPLRPLLVPPTLTTHGSSGLLVLNSFSHHMARVTLRSAGHRGEHTGLPDKGAPVEDWLQSFQGRG